MVAFDGRLEPARTIRVPELSNPVSISGWDSLLVASEAQGGVTAVRLRGPDSAEATTLDSLVVSPWGAAAPGERVVIVRSPYYLPYYVEFEPAPMIAVTGRTGRPVKPLVPAQVPAIPTLVQIVNAGTAAVDSAGNIYFAPLARDEVRKYSASGALLWTASRGLPFGQVSPSFTYVPGSGPSDTHVNVNYAVALGPPPDGLVYVLSARDTVGGLRLDVLDPATGSLLRTHDDIPAHGTVAVERGGRIRTPDPEELLARARAPEREPFAPAFALPRIEGDTLRLTDVQGKVTLVNFWASWCDPCREEFPHMIALYRELPRADFEIVAISDDVDRPAMLRFAQEFNPPFPVLVGGGRMREAYHYRGLPYSVLLDREGRIVERIFGFGGEAEFHRLHGRILGEIGR